ncbi:MAG: hypothetical protein P1V35_06455, partial [Planctomycetota bacterium]|nr:hypothetical protein [Planctomycetota bacterium]
GTHSFMACVDCHLTAPISAGPGSCTHCHFHEEGISADQHMEVKRYVWSSPQCIACHPDGH